MAEKAGVHAKAQESKQKCSNSCKQNIGFNSSGSPADRILQLQRTAGNQAVQKLIKSRALQTKLKIGQPNDIYEQEADRVAEQVTRMPNPFLQRKCTKCNKDKKKILQAKESPGQVPVNQGQDVPPVVHEVIRSPGHLLDPTTRTFMEPRFGYDFSRVRVHTGVQAAESARAVNALAYTAGQDLVFGVGQFAPGTDEGRRLIAHELTHVVQQSGAEWIRNDRGDEKSGSSRIASETNIPAMEIHGRHGRTLVQREACESLAPPNCSRGTCEEGKQCVGNAGDFVVCSCWPKPYKTDETDEGGSGYKGGGGSFGGGGSTDSWDE